MKKRGVKIIVIFLVFLILLEVSLRFLFGLGRPVLFVENKLYEYIYAPNQNLKRFGNKIITNEYSMRSLPISIHDSIRILKVGDSIINGGSLTDQDSLASTILEKELQKEYKIQIRVLNISAGSWGPDNAFEYINQNGTFGSQFMVLTFSSHDLYDSMEHEKIVDLDPSYPSSNPSCAISELLFRYIIPFCKAHLKPGSFNKKITSNHISVSKEKINTGWKKFFEYAKKNKIKLLVVLHPTIEEIKERKYNNDAEKIIQMLNKAHVPFILELDNLTNTSFYRDDIHYNAQGQKFLVRELLPFMKEYIQEKIDSIKKTRNL
jgi:hypothetical protein